MFDSLADFGRTYLGDLAALTTAVAWSVAVIFFRKAGLAVKPMLLNLYKSVIASLLFLLMLAISGESWLPDLSAENWLRLMISAFFGITIGDLLFLASLERLGAGFQAIVDCMYAPFIIVLAFVMLDESLPAWTIGGGALVVSAVLVGASQRGSWMGSRREVWEGIAYGVLAQLLMAFSVLLIRDLLRAESLLWITTFRFSVGTLLIIGWGLLRYRSDVLTVFRRGPATRNMLIGTLLGPFLATMLWLAGFKYTLAGRASIYNQMATIFIIILAAMFLNEPLTKRRLVAVALGIGGVLIVSLS